MQNSAKQSRTRAISGASPEPNAIESCRRSGRSVGRACPCGPGTDRTRRASKRRWHFGCSVSFPSSRPPDANVLSWAFLNPPQLAVTGDFGSPPRRGLQHDRFTDFLQFASVQNDRARYLDARADRHLADRRLDSFKAHYRAGEAVSGDAAKGQPIYQINQPSARAGRWENKATHQQRR